MTRRMPRRPCRTSTRGDGVETDIRPQQYLEALGQKPCARTLPLGIGEGIGTGDHRYDVADVQCNDMLRQLGRGYTFALQRARCDRHQAIELASVNGRVVPARD